MATEGTRFGWAVINFSQLRMAAVFAWPSLYFLILVAREQVLDAVFEPPRDERLLRRAGIVGIAQGRRQRAVRRRARCAGGGSCARRTGWRGAPQRDQLLGA